VKAVVTADEPAKHRGHGLEAVGITATTSPRERRRGRCGSAQQNHHRTATAPEIVLIAGAAVVNHGTSFYFFG
jgi:hypothetical protein